jgi:hypothetical protein
VSSAGAAATGPKKKCKVEPPNSCDDDDDDRFAATTPVLLADGTRKHINDISGYKRAQAERNDTAVDLGTYYVVVGSKPVVVLFGDNPNGPNCAPPGHVYRGGIYKNLKDPGTKKNVPGTEINHIPSKQSTLPVGIRPNDGSAIQMDYQDHRDVTSTGSSIASQVWQKKQKDLVAAGRIDEAIQMDINDIRVRFGTKYNRAIAEMIAGLATNSRYLALRRVPSTIG